MNIVDAQAILNYVVGKGSVSSTRADVNGDKKVDSIDAALIKQYVAGLPNASKGWVCPL